MNKKQRADEFTRLVGLELKGRIVSSGTTAQAVAAEMGRSAAALSRWLNGHVPLPMSVLCEACELIDVDPQVVVETAYSRLAVAFGERDGSQYDDEAIAYAREEIAEQTSQPIAPVVSLPRPSDDDVIPENLAARTRKTPKKPDVPHAE